MAAWLTRRLTSPKLRQSQMTASSSGPRKGYSVGPSVSTSNKRYLEVDEEYKSDYKELRGDDGTFLWSGPSLKEPINLEEPRFQCWVKDTKRQSKYTKIPGGLSHANQPNERLALVQARQAKVVFAYTSRRRNGLTINQLRTVIDVFLRTYLDGRTIANTELALNLDGGGSVFVGYHSKGKTYHIVAGDQQADEAVPLGLRDPAGLKFRAVANFVRHDLTPSPGNGGSSKHPAPNQSEGPPNKKPNTGGPEPTPSSPPSGSQPPKPPGPQAHHGRLRQNARSRSRSTQWRVSQTAGPEAHQRRHSRATWRPFGRAEEKQRGGKH